MYLALPVHAKKKAQHKPKNLHQSRHVVWDGPTQPNSFNGIAVFDPTRQSLFFSRRRRRRGWLSPPGENLWSCWSVGWWLTQLWPGVALSCEDIRFFFGVPGRSRGNINHLWSRGYCAPSSRREKPARPRSPSSGEEEVSVDSFFSSILCHVIWHLKSEVEREKEQKGNHVTITRVQLWGRCGIRLRWKQHTRTNAFGLNQLHWDLGRRWDFVEGDSVGSDTVNILLLVVTFHLCVDWGAERTTDFLLRIRM